MRKSVSEDAVVEIRVVEARAGRVNDHGEFRDRTFRSALLRRVAAAIVSGKTGRVIGDATYGGAGDIPERAVHLRTPEISVDWLVEIELSAARKVEQRRA